MRRSLTSPGSVFALTLTIVLGCSTGTPPGAGDDAQNGGTGGSAKAGAGGSAGHDTTGGAGGSSTGGSGAGTGGTLAAGGGGGTTGGGAGTQGGAGTGGTTTGGASGSAGTISAGGQAGTAGTGVGGIAGTSAGGGVAGAATNGGMAGGSGMGAGGAPAAWPACSPDALFCSGFEDPGLPSGATYLSSNDNNDPTIGLAFDTAIFHGGAQAVEVLKIASYSQREIVVPAAQIFWFRAYLRTDVAIGGADGNNHNLFFEAAYPGGDKGVEIVEEDCELGMNINDTRYGSNGTMNQPGCPTAAPLGTQLAADTWHCFEGYFDGTKGDFSLYVNKDEVVTQTGVAAAKQAFSTLRFGYRQYHERQRLVWYDDVVTGPTRIGCP
jgi:hypothetical protein